MHWNRTVGSSHNILKIFFKKNCFVVFSFSGADQIMCKFSSFRSESSKRFIVIFR